MKVSPFRLSNIDRLETKQIARRKCFSSYFVLEKQAKKKFSAENSRKNRRTLIVERESVDKGPMLLSTKRIALMIFASSFPSMFEAFGSVGLIVKLIFDGGRSSSSSSSDESLELVDFLVAELEKGIVL